MRGCVGYWIFGLLGDLSNGRGALYKCTSERNTPSHIQSITSTDSLPLHQLITVGLTECRPYQTQIRLHPITMPWRLFYKSMQVGNRSLARGSVGKLIWSIDSSVFQRDFICQLKKYICRKFFFVCRSSFVRNDIPFLSVVLAVDRLPCLLLFPIFQLEMMTDHSAHILLLSVLSIRAYIRSQVNSIVRVHLFFLSVTHLSFFFCMPTGRPPRRYPRSVVKEWIKCQIIFLLQVCKLFVKMEILTFLSFYCLWIGFLQK